MKRLYYFTTVLVFLIITSNLLSQKTAPYSQNFDGTSSLNPFPNLDEWRVKGPGANDIYLVTSTDQSGTTIPSSPNAVEFNDGAWPSDSSFLISPEFTDLGSYDKRISFRVAFESALASQVTLFVGVISDTSDLSTFIPLDTISGADFGSNTDFNFYEYDLIDGAKIGTAKHVAIVHGPGAYEAYIDDFTYDFLPSCIRPSNLGIVSLTDNSADLSWIDNNSSTPSQWQVSYGSPNFDPNTGTKVIVNSNSTTLNGLTSDTDYEFYVRAICAAGDTSIWSTESVIFTTLCAPITSFPYTEDVEGSSAYCWFPIDANADGDSWIINTSSTYANSGSKSYRFFSNSNAGNNNDFLVSPSISLTGNQRLNYYFRAYTSSQPNDYMVLVSTTGTNPSDFTDTLLKDTISNTSHQLQTLYLDSYTGNVHLAFHIPNGGLDGYAIYIDDIEIEDIPSCVRIDNLMINNITHNSADLSWIDNNSSTPSEWQVSYGAPNFNPDTGTMVIANSSPFTLSGLTDNTDYEVYVRSICAAGDTSIWNLVEGSFATSCMPITSLPYMEDVETSSADCWTVINANNDPDQWSVYTSSTYANSGTRSFRIYTDGNSGNNNDYLVSPSIALTGNQRLNYYYRTRSTSEPNDYMVLVSTTGMNPSDFTDTILKDTSRLITYQMQTLDLSSYTGSVHIAFYIPNGGLDGWYLYIDDIVVEDIPSCLRIDNLSISNITPNSADLSWTDNNSPVSSQWQISYGTPGFNPDTGTMVIANSSTFTLPGLTDNTDYEIYIRSICGVGDTSFWNNTVGSFRTLCITTNMINENFDGVTTPNLPGCWSSLLVNNTASDAVRTSTSADATAPNGVQIYYSSSSSTKRLLLISPQLNNVGAGTHRLRFNARNTSSAQEIVIGTISDPTDINTVTYIDTIDINSSFAEYISSFQNVSTTDEYIVFTRITSSSYTSVYIDDVVWEAIPTCYRVDSLMVDNITINSADLSWKDTNSSPMAWEISYGPSGFNPNTGTKVIANSNPFTLSGLTDNTGYEFYVRAICSAGDSSYWNNNSGNFRTACIATDSINENFDGITTPNLPGCWSSLLVNNSSSDLIGTSTSADASAPNGVQIYHTSSSSGKHLLLISPKLNNLGAGTHWLRFNARNNSTSQDVVIGTMSDPTDVNTLTLLDTIDINTTFSEYTRSFQNVSTTDEYIVFSRLLTSTYTRVYIDDIIWEPLPTCFRVDSLMLPQLSSSFAEISWADPNSSTPLAWEISYGSFGFDPNTGTKVITTSNPYRINNLMSDTEYEVYVRAICSAGDTSDWNQNSIRFKTFCSPETPNYLEDFNSSSFPNCWTEADNGSPSTGVMDVGSSSWGSDNFANVSSNSRSLYINIYDDEISDWMISPLIDLSNTNNAPYFVEFDFSTQDYNSSSMATDGLGSDDTVQLLISNDYGNSWTAIQTWDASNTPVANGGIYVTNDLSAYTGDTVFLAFWASEGTVNDGEDVDVMIDNFSVNSQFCYANDTNFITACDSTTITSKSIKVTSSGFYNDTIVTQVGCDTIQVYRVDINNSISQTINYSSCDSVMVNSTLYYNDTIINDTLSTTMSCDSIIIRNITVNKSVNIMAPVAASCDSVNINGNWYFSSQTVIDTMNTVSGCDSIINTPIVISPVININAPNVMACDSAMINNKWYYNTQNVVDSFTSVSGCDSIVTTALTINNSTLSNVNLTACDSAMINGNWYSSTQMVRDTLQTTNGCDSIIVTNLTINQSVMVNATAVIGCDSAIINNNWYYSSQIVMDTFQTANSCDSIIITNLTINQSSVVNSSQQICANDSILFAGNYYKMAGTYYDTLKYTSGCDSIINVLQLTVNSLSASTLNDSVCDGSSYSFGGNSYSVAGTYYDTLSNSLGCDSIITLNLSIINNSLPNTSISVSDPSICESDTAYFMSMVPNMGTTSTTYQWLLNGNAISGQNNSTMDASSNVVYQGVISLTVTTTNGNCMRTDTSSTITLSRTSNPIVTISNNGNGVLTSSISSVPGNLTYQWLLNGSPIAGETNDNIAYTQNGDYSLVVTDVNGCSTTSAIINIQDASIEDISLSNSVKVYPNPNNGIFNIQSDYDEDIDVRIYDYTGKIVREFKLTSKQRINVDLSNYSSGMYIVKMETVSQKVVTKRIIVQQ